MVLLDKARQRQEHQPGVQECRTRARIYHDQHALSTDMKKLRKHGWKLTDIQWRHVPVQMERIRATGPGALVRGTAWEMVAFYTRCGISERGRLDSLIPRRHAILDGSDKRLN